MTTIIAILIATSMTAHPRPLATISPIEAPAPSVTGSASWYDWHRGQAAAGPALRRLLGKGWRNKSVRVCASGRCIRVRLTDWCQCYRETARERVIDLDDQAFRRLAPLSRGLIEVTVQP